MIGLDTPAGISGSLVGLGTAAGLLLVAARLPVVRRPSLDDRLAPYLGAMPEFRRYDLTDRAVTPFPTLERILRPFLVRAADAVERALGGAASVRRRLDQVGSPMTVHDFRIEQVVWGAAAFGAGMVLSLLLLAQGTATSPVALLIFCLAAAAFGVIDRDQRLSRDVKRREERMLAEFPTVADLLALSVAAGEGPAAALERVARVGSGELAAELGRALADMRSGRSLVQALDRVAERTSLPALSRFVDGVAVAIERGTPLADVLRAQACDVRDDYRRHLLEVGGRKEIAMMVPVVFLVLPVTVLFALYPGFLQLSQAVP